MPALVQPPAKKWRVALRTTSAPTYDPFRTCKEAMEEAEYQRYRAEDPERDHAVTEISVQKWDARQGRWIIHQKIWSRLPAE